MGTKTAALPAFSIAGRTARRHRRSFLRLSDTAPHVALAVTAAAILTRLHPI